MIAKEKKIARPKRRGGTAAAGPETAKKGVFDAESIALIRFQSFRVKCHKMTSQ